MAVVFGALGWWPHSPRAAWRLVAAETAVVLVLYALWLRAGELDPLGTEGGLGRGLRVWDIERWLHLPREQWLQQGPLANRLVLQASNLYYAGVHVPAMGVFLVWMYFRHRDHYRSWRTTLALTTGICLVIRYIPVAPPRFYPELGFVDTALQFNQSVYGAQGAGVSAQFAAMPSIHVAWGVLIGVAAWRASSSRWRWIAVVHAVATVYVVTSTANHWWLDGIVGAAFLVPAYWVARRLAGGARRSVVVGGGVVGQYEVPPVEAVPAAVRHDVAGLPDAILGRVAE
jgi:PAP2 superfamily